MVRYRCITSDCSVRDYNNFIRCRSIQVGYFWTRGTNGQGFFHFKHILEKFQKIIKYVFNCLRHTEKSDMYNHSFKKYGSIYVLASFSIIFVHIKCLIYEDKRVILAKFCGIHINHQLLIVRILCTLN
jgi:hypothetical protein